MQIILSLLKEKVAKQPLGAEDLAAAATVAVGAAVAPKVSAMSGAMAHEWRAMCIVAGHSWASMSHCSKFVELLPAEA